MEEKICFLDKLCGLFKTYGAKALTMDDIAKEFSISKKTLYQQYKNKEDLLSEVLDFISNKAIEEAETVRSQYQCPVEIMYVTGLRIDEVTTREKDAFVVQLIKYYPEVFLQHQKSISSRIIEMLTANYKEGLQVDLYRKDIPIDMFIKFFITLLFSVDVSPFLEEVEGKNEISKHIKHFYLNAIVTEKGKTRLKELNKKYEELG